MSTDDPEIVDYQGKILTEDDVNQRVAELTTLILSDSQLKNFRKGNCFLLRFLHCTDFNVPAAFKRLQDYHKHLRDHPDWFASTSPFELKERISDCGKAILRGRDRKGRKIFLMKAGAIDATKTTPQEQAQIDELYFEYIWDDPQTQAKGVAVIMDMSGYSWALFKFLTPSNIRTSTRKIDLLPFKTIVSHVVNTSFLVSTSIKLIWPFLSQNLKDRVKFHFEDWPSLHEYISPEVLPPEYGGTAPEIDFEKLNEGLFEQASEIAERVKLQRTVKK